MLQSMGSQRVRHDLAIKQKQITKAAKKEKKSAKFSKTDLVWSQN